MRACEGKCGKSYETDEEPPAETETTVPRFLCFPCAMSWAMFAAEEGIEPFAPEDGSVP